MPFNSSNPLATSALWSYWSGTFYIVSTAFSSGSSAVGCLRLSQGCSSSFIKVVPFCSSVYPAEGSVLPFFREMFIFCDWVSVVLGVWEGTSLNLLTLAVFGIVGRSLWITASLNRIGLKGLLRFFRFHWDWVLCGGVGLGAGEWRFGPGVSSCFCRIGFMYLLSSSD